MLDQTRKEHKKKWVEILYLLIYSFNCKTDMQINLYIYNDR